MMLKKLFTTAATAIALACTTPAVIAGPSSITVFGDSLSDGGNDFNYTLFATGGGFGFPPPPYAQRFTNGPTAVEVLAANLHLPLTPSFGMPTSVGLNYAYGGAETGTGNYLAVRPDVPPIINTIFGNPPATGVAAQVQSFVDGGGTFAPKSLVVLWAGSNDLFTELTKPSPDPASVIAPALTNLSNEVGALYAVGARHILMPNMPDLGLTPFGLSLVLPPPPVVPNPLTQFSMAFNLGLEQAIDQLEFFLPGLDIIDFDTFGALGSLIANFNALGFTNSTGPCVNPVTLVACANPDEYIFWDSVHPTARVNQSLGAQLASVVPEPTTFALFALALAGAGFLRRRSLA